MDGCSLMGFQGGRMACTQPGAPGPAPKGRGQTANGRQCTRMGKGSPQMAQMTADGGDPPNAVMGIGKSPSGNPKGILPQSPWLHRRGATMGKCPITQHL